MAENSDDDRRSADCWGIFVPQIAAWTAWVAALARCDPTNSRHLVVFASVCMLAALLGAIRPTAGRPPRGGARRP